ncbi:FxDxF family PEP-CTERM protein [Methylotenera sp. 1P/1]|jgi:hypothetical protein|uniref:FxDxF family PEP-CTERM protein n=1 Tax=Methylotenera sp. 1P/1 TaxID=1131551 RepID=UPI00037836FC|nr:FxDxF family PEP-CTERM protein [Methylotenera sp. 1P/1]
MKLKSIALATLLAASASSAYAGNFVTLTSGVGGQLTAANGGLVTSTFTNPNRDPFYIETVSATFVDGYDADSNFETGDVVASSINYRAFNGSTTTSTGTLTLLDWRVTTGVDLSAGSPDQFDVYDFVYRDSADNKLVFGSRFLNRQENGEEANYVFRQGAGTNASVAWTYADANGLRIYQAGLTTDTTFNGSVAYDPNSVRIKSDLSVTEGNPFSAFYLIKTDAINYTLGANALGFFQAGEEGQSPAGAFISGYVAVTTVPEPESYAMMLAGLGVMGAVARRRRKV